MGSLFFSIPILHAEIVMSSLVCNATHCVFTRINTNDYAFSNYSYYPDRNFTTPPKPIDDAANGTYVDNSTAPWTDEANQDMLSDSVALTRDYRGGLFNALVPDDQYQYYAPSNTVTNYCGTVVCRA